jgi:hypothetical protein
MAEYSYPFTSNTGDRIITAAQQRALYAKLVGSGVLERYVGTVSGTTLSITDGACIIDGAYHDVNTGVNISLASIVGVSANIVARLDETARSIVLAVKETAAVNSGGVHEIVVGTLTKVGGIWQSPVFVDDLANPFRFSEAITLINAMQSSIEALQNATDDSGYLTSGITAATGWSIQAQGYRRIGKLMLLHLSATRTGAAITVGTDGDVTNTQVATLPVNYRPVNTYQPLSSSSTGRVTSGYAETGGAVYLASTTPGANIATGDTISLDGFLFVA